MSQTGPRVAVYYAPDPTDPLWHAGCAWLGRDPETGASPRQPVLPGINAVTAEPRLYGFHSTLKAPIRLRAPYPEFRASAEALARTLRPFELPPLAVVELSGFLALRETRPSPDLHALADACVAWLDPYRQPPEPAELAHRRRHGLSPAREALLQRWGYPGVFSHWRFHMTLTRRLLPHEHDVYRPAAERHFAPALAATRRVDALCLFTQAGPGEPFLIGERIPFAG